MAMPTSEPEKTPTKIVRMASLQPRNPPTASIISNCISMLPGSHRLGTWAPEKDQIQLPSCPDVTVLRGGPVETERGFVLHSADFFIENSTLPIDEGICLTATLDILKAIARGTGPASAVLALGYAGWSPGQLENEMQQNGWLHCSADRELIFGTAIDAKYERAMQKIGIRPGMLSNEVGHA